MNEPQMKAEIAVRKFDLEYGWISFDATPDAADTFKKFGKLDRYTSSPHTYTLWVDARYDLLELVAYIKAYGQSADAPTTGESME